MCVLQFSVQRSYFLLPLRVLAVTAAAGLAVPTTRAGLAVAAGAAGLGRRGRGHAGAALTLLEEGDAEQAADRREDDRHHARKQRALDGVEEGGAAAGRHRLIELRRLVGVCI